MENKYPEHRLDLELQAWYRDQEVTCAGLGPLCYRGHSLFSCIVIAWCFYENPRYYLIQDSSGFGKGYYSIHWENRGHWEQPWLKKKKKQPLLNIPCFVSSSSQNCYQSSKSWSSNHVKIMWQGRGHDCLSSGSAPWLERKCFLGQPSLYMDLHLISIFSCKKKIKMCFVLTRINMP